MSVQACTALSAKSSFPQQGLEYLELDTTLEPILYLGPYRLSCCRRTGKRRGLAHMRWWEGQRESMSVPVCRTSSEP